MPITSISTGDAGPETSAPAAKLWLRVDADTHAQIGTSREEIGAPTLVEMEPNGSLRTSGDSPRDVMLRQAVRNWPTMSSGLGLFVQRPIELRLDGPDGPAIGRARRGSYLPVIAYGPKVTEVALPGYETQRLARRVPVRVFVDSAALAAERVPLEPDAPRKIDARDNIVPLRATKDGEPFGATRCGPWSVVARDGQQVKVLQSSDGVEIEGWIAKEPEESRGSNVCPSRVVFGEESAANQNGSAKELPEGFVAFPVEPPQGSMQKVLASGGSVFWIVPGDGAALKCLEWKAQLRPAARPAVEGRPIQHKGELRLQPDAKGRWSSFEFDYWAGSKGQSSLIHITGPTSYVGSRVSGVGLCGESYTIVDMGADYVSLLPGEQFAAAKAYHAGDTEIWYSNRKSCEAAAAAAMRAGLGERSPVHPGC